MKFFYLDIKEVFNTLKTNENGLSFEEVNTRIKKYGKNKLLEAKKKSNLRKFLEEFKDLMIIILIISAFISFILSIINNESFIDSIIIL